MALYDMTASAEYWQTLLSEANWSKCVYTYGVLCCVAPPSFPESVSKDSFFRFGLQPRRSRRRDKRGRGEEAHGHSSWAHAANSRKIYPTRGMFTYFFIRQGIDFPNVFRFFF